MVAYCIAYWIPIGIVLPMLIALPIVLPIAAASAAGSWAGPAYTINKLDSDKDVNIMVVCTKKRYLSQKKFCREGANLRDIVHQQNAFFPKTVLPRRCQSKRFRPKFCPKKGTFSKKSFAAKVPI